MSEIGSIPMVPLRSYHSELHVPGSFPEPTIREYTSMCKTSLPADHGDGAPSTLRDMVYIALGRFVHAAEYFVWSHLCKFAQVERNTLMTVVVFM